MVRSSGQMRSATGHGCSDHACWAYRDRAERDAVAVDWLMDGATKGQRLVAVTGDADGGAALRAAITNDRRSASLRENAIIYRVEELYDLSRPIDSAHQLAIYEGAVQQAVADGFRGVRVFADITPLIANPARRASHASWEHYADGWISEGNLLAPLCAYDINALEVQPDAIVSLHPLRHGPPDAQAAFGLFWREGRRVLDGEINAFGLSSLREALAVLDSDDVEIDVRDVQFLNGSGAVALADAPVRLVGAPPMLRRLWELLDLDPRKCPSGQPS